MASIPTLDEFFDPTAVEIKEIHIRRMKQKWASCSSRGRLTFDPELMEKPRDIRLKAILHELLHLRYPNHGVMFRRMLQNHLKKLISIRLHYKKL